MISFRAVMIWLALFAVVTAPVALASPRVIQLTLDTSEADQALAIVDKAANHERIPASEWQALFETAPYRWLQQRELSMGRKFSNEDFEKFLLSSQVLVHRAKWKQTLGYMKNTDMDSLGQRVLDWLPPGAKIQARVFPEIKPASNSFVWHSQSSEPAIFLYLDHQTAAQFENTVAHECHHIGLDSLQAEQLKEISGLPPNVELAVKWLREFGEGEAMLAAAGSADRHPHWEDDGPTRARWDSNMMHFNSDLIAVQEFLMDILDGKLKTPEQISQRAAPFWGWQGAWYTVGYEMASLVEKQYGRETFDKCLLDPRQLLIVFNKIAEEANANGASLQTWSPQLIAKLSGKA